MEHCDDINSNFLSPEAVEALRTNGTPISSRNGDGGLLIWHSPSHGWLYAWNSMMESYQVVRSINITPEDWQQFSETCDQRIVPEVNRRPANALNVEIGSPAIRCALRSPDGRGAIWLLSGGSPLAYGCCERATCRRLRK